MNNKCKTVSIAAIVAAVAVFNFQSCKKYEDGPLLSFRTKKARLIGEWELEDSDNPYYNNQYQYEETIEFEKDGDFTKNTKMMFYGDTYEWTNEGDWEWEDKKETIELDYNNGSNVEMEILRLTNKELILEDESGYEWEYEKQ